jgi:tape measure domain-containing protein
MATDTYSIQIETAQAVSALGSLKSALGGLAAGFAIGGISTLVKEFATLSDSVTNMQNKLRNLDASNVQGQFKGLVDIATRSRAELEGVTEMYTKIAKAGQEMGMTQQQAANITENLSKAIQMSGKSAAEVSSIMTQIPQAFQSGKLAGDEFRSAMENLPIVAIQALAKELGVSTGELKKLASEGKITSEVMKNAFGGADFTKLINEQFAQSVPTISGALNNLKTAFIEAFANFEQHSQAGRMLADAINVLAQAVQWAGQHFDKLAIGVGILMQFTPAGRAITIAVAAFEALKRILEFLAPYWEKLKIWITDFVTAISNSAPIQAFGQAVSAIIEPIRQLVDLLIRGAQAFASWTGLDKVLGMSGAQGKTTMGGATQLEGAVGTPDGTQVGGTVGIGGQTGGTTNPYFSDHAVQNAQTLQTAMQQIHTTGQAALETYSASNAEKLKELEYANSLIGLKDQEREKTQLLHEEALNFYKAITPLQEQYEQLSKQGTEEAAQKAAAIKEEIDKITQAHDAYSQKITEILDKKQQALDAAKAQEQAEHAIAQAAERRKQIEGDIANLKSQQAEKVRNAQQQMDLKGLSGVQREMKRIQYEENNWADAAKNRVKEQWGTGDQEGLQQRLNEIDAIRNKTTQDLQGIAQQSSALEQQHTSSHQRISQGWGNTMNSMRQQSQEATTQVGGMFSRMSSGITDSIMGMVKSGKFDAKSLISAFEPLMKGGLDMLFNSLLGGGGKGGGIFDGLFGSASGGVGGLGNSITGLTNQLGSMQGAMGPNGKSGNPAFVNIAGGLDPLTQGFEQLGNVFSQGLDGLGSSLGGLFDGISGLFNGGGSSGGGLLGGLFGGGGGGGGGGGFLGDIFGGGGGGGGGGIFDTIGGFFDDIGSSFSGFFAQGGTIPGGKFGVVGENGPEFVSGPARVTPMSDMMGGSSVVNYNINAVDAQSFKQMLARDPEFIHAVAMRGASSTPRRR